MGIEKKGVRVRVPLRINLCTYQKKMIKNFFLFNTNALLKMTS